MPGPEGTSDDALLRALALSDAGDHLGALALADRIVALAPPCAGRAEEALIAYDAGLSAAGRLGTRAGVVTIALDDPDQALAERAHLRADRATEIARERLRRFGERASSLGGALPAGGS